MSAPASIELIRETAEQKLRAYIIRPCENGGFRLVRRCNTGETHVAFTLTEEAAEDVLMVKLRQLG